MNQDFPNDETGELLRLMREQGDDLSAARDIDFYLLFDLKEQAHAFASQAVVGPDFRVAICRYETTDKWQACLTVHMAPEYGELMKREKQVERLGWDFGGQSDGWGCAAAE